LSDRVVVIGFGVTGKAVASHLQGAGAEVVVLDDKADQAMAETGTDTFALLRGFSWHTTRRICQSESHSSHL
jgi:glutamate dehydrogenase/leucine dehydrogenase